MTAILTIEKQCRVHLPKLLRLKRRYHPQLLLRRLRNNPLWSDNPPRNKLRRNNLRLNNPRLNNLQRNNLRRNNPRRNNPRHNNLRRNTPLHNNLPHNNRLLCNVRLINLLLYHLLPNLLRLHHLHEFKLHNLLHKY